MDQEKDEGAADKHEEEDDEVIIEEEEEEEAFEEDHEVEVEAPKHAEAPKAKEGKGLGTEKNVFKREIVPRGCHKLVRQHVFNIFKSELCRTINWGIPPIAKPPHIHHKTFNIFSMEMCKHINWSQLEVLSHAQARDPKEAEEARLKKEAEEARLKEAEEARLKKEAEEARLKEEAAEAQLLRELHEKAGWKSTEPQALSRGEGPWIKLGFRDDWQPDFYAIVGHLDPSSIVIEAAGCILELLGDGKLHVEPHKSQFPIHVWKVED